MSSRKVMIEINWKQAVSIVGGVVGVAIVILFFYQTRPLWHCLFFGLIYRHIIGWIVTLILVILAIAFFFTAISDPYRVKWRWFGMLALVIMLWVGYFYWSTDVYGRAVANSFEPEIVRELPDTTNIRYIPYEAAETFANARQENPMKKVGDIDPVEIGGEFFWLAPRIPFGHGNWFFSQADGVMLVAEDGTVRFEPQTFMCGEGMAVTDAIAWKLFSRRYFAEYPEIFYLKIDGAWTAMAPYVTYDFHFPVFVPKWGGVMLVHPNCRIEDLSPEQAQADPRLAGRRIFPEALAKIYSLSWGYRYGGLWNILFYHHEQVEATDLEGTTNEMPYYVPTTWGPQWMIAAEPEGPSQSVSRIFWFDAHNGQAKLTEFTEAVAPIGPNRGFSFAKSETPGYVWREGEEGTYLAIEPRPIIRGSVLYWQYSVTTFKYTGVGLTVLVNSLNSEDVLHFCSRASLIQWLAGEGESDPVPCTRAVEAPFAAPPAAAPDLTQLSTEDLYQLLRQIIDELERRGQ